MQDEYVGLIVPKSYVKTVKVALERSRLHNSKAKIRSLISGERTDVEYFIIPTSVLAKPVILGDGIDAYQEQYRKEILDTLREHGVEEAIQDITFTEVRPTHQQQQSNARHGKIHYSSFQDAIESAEISLPGISISSVADLLASLPTSHSVYPPLLLLPPKILEEAGWKRFFDSLDSSKEARQAFFASLARARNVTHIAIDAHIPAKASLSSEKGGESDPSNILRSPYNIKPQWGDFGPTLSSFPQYIPTTTDFNEAFWVSTRQNGTFQTWAPLYTMFSSGNVTEKARILDLESVRAAVQTGKEDGLGCSAVDLYSGIGYFAFSYAKAGASKVLCWDLNPWSIEGLRRGSLMNKWTVEVVNANAQNPGFDLFGACKNSTKLLAFCESNSHAAARIHSLRGLCPPIRHVNCGMLPSADSMWPTAVQTIDPSLGGWVHLHETVFEDNFENRVEDVVSSVQRSFRDIASRTSKEDVLLESVTRVKSIGPRLLHIVLDIWIPPRGSSHDVSKKEV